MAMKKIISTFILAHPYEVELLYIKLVNESSGVDAWIPIESNSYVQWGIPKDFVLPEMLKQPRFAPFLDRISPVLNTKTIFEPYWEKTELSNFQAEFKSRSLCFDFLRENFDNEDYIIMCDIDESLDFSCPKRAEKLYEIFDKNNCGIEINIQKYWYQLNCMYFGDKWIVAHPLGLLKSGPNSFYHKQRYCKRIQTSPLGFEYSNFFTPEQILHKYDTSSHQGYNIESIHRGLKYCCWHRCEALNEVFMTDINDLFEVVELIPNNSPVYVRENLEQINLNTVDKNYADHREDIGVIRHHPNVGDNKVVYK